MSKHHAIGTNLSSRQTLWGFIYMVFQLVALGPLLVWANVQLEAPLSEAELNFTFYIINFIAILLIFQDFLGNSLGYATSHLVQLLEAVILGYVFYQICFRLTNFLVTLLYPPFTNYNDEAILSMKQGNFFLMALGTVVLVPPVEECFFRGLIFRNLYPSSKWAAYLVSILAFAAIHILGYIGTYSPLELVLAVLQYLPAGLCLAWSYTRADTIFAPILIHAAINATAIGLLF